MYMLLYIILSKSAQNSHGQVWLLPPVNECRVTYLTCIVLYIFVQEISDRYYWSTPRQYKSIPPPPPHHPRHLTYSYVYSTSFILHQNIPFVLSSFQYIIVSLTLLLTNPSPAYFGIYPPLPLLPSSIPSPTSLLQLWLTCVVITPVATNMSATSLPANVHISRHPCVQAKLSQLRSTKAGARETRALLHEISTIIAVEATAAGLTVKDGPIVRMRKVTCIQRLSLIPKLGENHSWL
jgi:hypothetical protein